MVKQPYTLRMPMRQTSSLVLASPHSGRDYPISFLKESILDAKTIRSSEDAFVDILFEDGPSLGVPLLAASAPRAFVDLNRANDELDPALIDGVRSKAHNPRVSSGLGVIPRVVSNGRPIYHGKITLDAARGRIRDHWRPYHDRLRQLLDDTRACFDEVVLIDCHSMPHEALETAVNAKGPLPDIVLGDRFGAAAAPQVVERIEAAFAAAGLKVQRNTPFAGAYTTQHYGRPSRGQHVVQVEIDRSLYMNEADIRPNDNFPAFKGLMRQVVAELAAFGRDKATLAAE